MYKLKVYLVLLFLQLPHPAFASNNNYGNFYNVKVINNYDGDTLTVDIPDIPPLFGDNISVRVLGIDTPEIRGKCEKERTLAKEAKEVVADIIKDTPYVALLNTDRDKYFRILADVKTARGDLATILLDKGLAVQYNGGTKEKDWCK
jgi:endonuclease YncB( thermonuclease family)